MASKWSVRLSKEAIFYYLLLVQITAFFHFNEQVPVDRNMLVFFFCPLLMINNKLQMNHVASGFSYISFPSSVGTVKILLFFPQDHRDRAPFCNWFQMYRGRDASVFIAVGGRRREK